MAEDISYRFKIGYESYNELKEISNIEDRTIAWLIRKAIKEFLDREGMNNVRENIK